MTTEERAPELNALMRAAHGFATRFKVRVMFATPYMRYFVRPDGTWYSEGTDLGEDDRLWDIATTLRARRES